MRCVITTDTAMSNETHSTPTKPPIRQTRASIRQPFEVPKIDALLLRLRSLNSKNSTNVAALSSILIDSPALPMTILKLPRRDGPPTSTGWAHPARARLLQYQGVGIQAGGERSGRRHGGLGAPRLCGDDAVVGGAEEEAMVGEEVAGSGWTGPAWRQGRG